MIDVNSAANYLQNVSDNVFLIDDETNQTYTYKMLHESARAIGGFLVSKGLKKGDRLIITMDNSIILAKIYFACLYAGIIVIPVNPDCSEEQVNYVVTHGQATYFLTSEKYRHKIPKENINTIVLDEKGLSKSPHVHQVSDFENHPQINLNDLHGSNIAVIIYTSGTTSQAKGVIHTVFDLVGNGHLFVDIMGVTEKSRFYNILPMTYLGGYYNLLLIPYLANSSVVISSAFNPQAIIHFWSNVKRHQINTLWLVPTMMAILMEVDRNSESSEYAKNNIILAFVGTAPLPKKLKAKFEEKYGFQVYENYGLSETLFISTHLPRTNSEGVGKILPGVHLKIQDNNGNTLPEGEEGEILVNTPFVMNQYVGLENSFNKYHDEWFYTGDIGYLDDKNNLHITDRKKDLIILGGINMSPAVIEEVIMRHPAIKDCAVVGIPHPLSGEEIIAVVTMHDDFNFKDIKPHLIDNCKKALSPIQQPSHFVDLSELPRTYTGKIQKAKLRAWLVNNKKNASHKIQINKKKTHDVSLTHSHTVENVVEALSISYNTMVYELQSQNIDVTVLSLGEAFFDMPLYDFNKLPHPALFHYSHSRGVSKLRQVLAQYFQEQYEVKFDPASEIIVTAGSKIAIYMTLLALINPGDEVLYHEPAWVSYPEQIKLCHGIPVSVPYHETVYDFEKYITNKTKVLIINNPNNPRGSVLSLDEIAHLYKLAQNYNLYILSDEAYSDFVSHKEQFISIGNFDKELKYSIICNSISKNFGISGWRIGYVIANQNLIAQILKLNQHLITCPATILEYYIADHFDEILNITKPQIADLLKKREVIIEYIQKIGLSCLEGNTTFYLFLSIGDTLLSSQAFCKLLLEQYRISVVPGIGYGHSCDRFVRVSVGSEPLDRIFAAMDKIKELIHQTKNPKLLSLSQQVTTMELA